MFCPNCGKEIPKHVNFCPNCGTNIKEYLEQTNAEGDNHKKNEYTQNYSFLQDNIFADDLNVAREDEVKVIDKDNNNDLFSNTSYFDIEDVFYVLDDEEELENIRERKKAKEEKLQAEKIEKLEKEKRERLEEEKRKREEENEVFVSVDYEEPEDEENPAQEKFNTMKQRLIEEQNIDETIHEPIKIDGDLNKAIPKEDKGDTKDKDSDKNNIKDTVDNAKGYVNKFIELLKKKSKLGNEKFLREFAIKGNTAGKFYNIMEIILLVLATLTPVTLFIQKISSTYQITGRSNSPIWFILLAIIFTIFQLIANVFTQYAGLKMASFYLDYGFDKATRTSYVLFLATLYSILSFILFFILKTPIGIDAVLSQKLLGIKPVITVILIILNIWIIVATLWDRFKDEKALKVTGMTTLGVILSYIAIYLIMSTLMRVFLGFTVPELLKLY